MRRACAGPTPRSEPACWAAGKWGLEVLTAEDWDGDGAVAAGYRGFWESGVQEERKRAVGDVS